MGWAFQWRQVDGIVGRHPQTRFLPILLCCPHEVCIARIRQRYETAPERYDPPEVYLTEPKLLAIWEYLESLDCPDVYRVETGQPFDQVYLQVKSYALDQI